MMPTPETRVIGGWHITITEWSTEESITCANVMQVPNSSRSCMSWKMSLHENSTLPYRRAVALGRSRDARLLLLLTWVSMPCSSHHSREHPARGAYDRRRDMARPARTQVPKEVRARCDLHASESISFDHSFSIPSKFHSSMMAEQNILSMAFRVYSLQTSGACCSSSSLSLLPDKRHDVPVTRHGYLMKVYGVTLLRPRLQFMHEIGRAIAVRKRAKNRSRSRELRNREILVQIMITDYYYYDRHIIQIHAITYCTRGGHRHTTLFDG